jgi:hypothetical protein
MNFQTKCNILGQFWFEFRDDDKLKDFIEYNDIGLPLAWYISAEVVDAKPMAEDYINETFSLFLSALAVSEEEAEQFQTLDDLLSYVEMRNDI